MVTSTTIVSLEPYPYHGGAQRDHAVHHLEPGGKIVYEEPKTPHQKLEEAVISVFNNAKVTGTFNGLTVEELAKRPEDDPFLLNENQKSEEPTKALDGIEEEDEEVKMTFMEMKDMKSAMWNDLGLAYQKVDSIIQLCRSLLPPEQPIRVPGRPPQLPPPTVLPPSTIGMTTVSRPTVLRPSLIEGSRLAIARNRKGIADAQSALGDAVSRMRGKEPAEQRFWHGVTGLSGIGQESGGKRWGVLPMWTQGVEFVKADRQMAKDVMIMYTPDEADPAIRLHYRAQIPQDTTLTASSERLLFPMVQTRSRLRVTLSTLEDGLMSSQIASPKEGELSDILDDVQGEAFDQEIFTAIQIEADKMKELDARISVGKVVVKAGPSMELGFEMINVDDIEEVQPTDFKALPDLLLSVTRLLMIARYRHRRLERALHNAHATLKGKKVAPPIIPPPPPTPLATLIPFLHYRAFSKQLRQLLASVESSVADVGLKLKTDWEGSGDVGGMIWEDVMTVGLRGEDGKTQQDDAGGTIEVTLEGRQICSILIGADCDLTLALPHVMLRLRDIAQLPVILFEELHKVLLSSIRDVLVAQNPSAAEVSVDDNAGAVMTKDVKYIVHMDHGPVAFRITRQSALRESGVEQYRAGTGLPLLRWVAAED